MAKKTLTIQAAGGSQPGQVDGTKSDKAVGSGATPRKPLSSLDAPEETPSTDSTSDPVLVDPTKSDKDVESEKARRPLADGR